jgi:spermidine synthase
MLDSGNIRFTEKHTEDYGIFIDSQEILYSKRSKYQLVEVIKTKTWGNVLLLDRNIMTTENDEYVYHEMLNHIPVYAAKKFENILVIGGGDGGSIRELLRHKDVKKVTMVEIDGDVIEVCKKYLPSIASAFDDPRANVIVGDGIKFVKETDEKFDIIIIDSSDPFGPAEGLFSVDFYNHCKRILNPGGILTCQAGNAFMTAEALLAYANLKKVFKNVEYYLANILTYGGLWGFAFASDERKSQEHFNEKLFDEENLEFKYYSKEIHKACFALPPFFRKKLEEYAEKHS